MENKACSDTYFYDIEIYFDDELVYTWRQFSFESIKTIIEVTETIYTKLYFIKNKCKDWNYKAVIK